MESKQERKKRDQEEVEQITSKMAVKIDGLMCENRERYGKRE